MLYLSVCPYFIRVHRSPSILRPNLQRSRQRFEIGQHLCRMFAARFECILAVRIFAATLAQLWLHLKLLWCFAASRVPSFAASVALGRTWLLAILSFTELHKAPHFQKCPFLTSMCEHLTSVQQHDISKMLNVKMQSLPNNALITKRLITLVPCVKQNTALQ